MVGLWKNMTFYTQIPQCEIAFSCAAFNRRYYGEQFLQSLLLTSHSIFLYAVWRDGHKGCFDHAPCSTDSLNCSYVPFYYTLCLIKSLEVGALELKIFFPQHVTICCYSLDFFKTFLVLWNVFWYFFAEYRVWLDLCCQYVQFFPCSFHQDVCLESFLVAVPLHIIYIN